MKIRAIVTLALLLSSVVAHAIRKGTPSQDKSVVLLLRGGSAAGNAVLISEKFALTIGHVASPGTESGLEFTFAEDGRTPASVGQATRGRFVKGAHSPSIKVSPQYNDNLVLLLVDSKDRGKLKGIKFPKLPGPGHSLITPQMKPRDVTLVGYGKTARELAGGTPVFGMRNQGIVTVGGWAPDFPSFTTMAGMTDQYTRGMDSGCAVLDGETVVGITSLIGEVPDLPLDRAAPGATGGVHVWLNEPSLRKWLEDTMKSWSGS